MATTGNVVTKERAWTVCVLIPRGCHECLQILDQRLGLCVFLLRACQINTGVHRGQIKSLDGCVYEHVKQTLVYTEVRSSHWMGVCMSMSNKHWCTQRSDQVTGWVCV